jgi:hypothetical protein
MRPKTPNHSSPNQANTLPELAQKMSVPLMRVKRLVRDGLCRRADGSFSLEDARLLAQERSSRGPDPLGDSAKGLYWKRRKLRAEAKQRELDFEVSRGKLVALADVKRIWLSECVKITNALKGLGRQIAAQCSHRGPQEIQAVVDKRVLEILRDLHNRTESTQPVSEKGT